MNIGFTGHRNKVTGAAELEQIAQAHPDATWVHGGAAGFDTQVQNFAALHHIPTIVIVPDYRLHGRAAPLIRNRAIVDKCTVVYACYDGRNTGGTCYTIKYAQKNHKTVHILSPV